MQARLALFLILASTGAAQRVVSSGTVEIPGTYLFSFDKGALVSPDLVLADWRPRRVLLPYIHATAAYPGKVDYDGLTPEMLSAYSYGQGRLDATDSSVITVGTVIAIRTNNGNLAKVVIKSVPERGHSGPLVLDWVAYRASNGEVLKSGSVEMVPGMGFSFDDGVAVDVFWVQWTDSTRALVVYPPAKLTNAGVRDFDLLSVTDIKELVARTKAPSAERIYGGDDNNALVPGDVFVVRTGAGNYAKAVVTAPLDLTHNHGLIFRWVTYAGQ
jgi:hypothetical protein